MKLAKGKDDVIFDIINTTLLVLVLLVILYPLYFIVIASVSDPLQVINGSVTLYPKNFTLEGYRMVFRDSAILRGYRNTILYTVFGTLLNIALTVLGAFPLSRPDFVGKQFFTILLTITMFFSGGLIPLYLLMNSLRLVNTVWAILLPGAVSVWNIIIMRTYIQTSIPMEMQEAAIIDGASNAQLLLRIILPLSAPVLAVMVLFYGVGHWNAFFNAMIYLQDKNLFPLQLILRSILIQNQASDAMMALDETLANRQIMAEGIKYALIIVASAPIIAIYPFLQKYFVQGMMVGSIKG